MIHFITHAPLTCFLIVIHGVVFILEVEYAVKPWQAGLRADITTLLSMGGVSAQTFKDVGAFRLLSSAFLHGDLVHLSINMLALAFAGRMIEECFGKLSLLPVFILCASAASLFSIVMNPPYILSIGASGAIMGMLFFGVTLFMLHPRYKDHVSKNIMLMHSLWIILPSLLPLARAGTQVTDYMSHVGGCVMGLSLGIFVTAFAAVKIIKKISKLLLQILTLLAIATLLHTAFRVISEYPLFLKVFLEP